MQRCRLHIKGVVQGVGFRPFVYGLAKRLGLAGFVGNDSAGVFVELEGRLAALRTFQIELISHPPPLAHIEQVATDMLELTGDSDFIIVHSCAITNLHTLVPTDLAICKDCLLELLDPQDRRYRYPFVSCNNCGPRFTIIWDLPYDRPFTTMAAFPLCSDCHCEYEDPFNRNRRFYTQLNACPVCGPQLEFRWSHSQIPPNLRPSFAPEVQSAHRDEALRLAQRVLAHGGIVAVKGIGGFHLTCDATDDAALQTLRQRKGRVDKPFAVMAKDIEIVHGIAYIDDAELELLTSRERPIVLLRKKPDSPLSALVAPGNPCIGVMLPYTPLHYLLFHQPEQPHTSRSMPAAPCPLLLMTSGNYSDEPIAKENDEALDQLADLADAFLLHNRAIHVHCDDSVLRMFEGHELPIRRSRGYAPFPIKLPFAVRPVLAVGGELKNTF